MPSDKTIATATPSPPSGQMPCDKATRRRRRRLRHLLLRDLLAHSTAYPLAHSPLVHSPVDHSPCQPLTHLLRSLLRWNRRTRFFARASVSWRQRPRRYARFACTRTCTRAPMPPRAVMQNYDRFLALRAMCTSSKFTIVRNMRIVSKWAYCAPCDLRYAHYMHICQNPPDRVCTRLGL